MQNRLEFSDVIFDSVVGGVSVLDLARLHLKDLHGAREFIKAYGFDMEKKEDLESVWDLHKNAVTMLRDRILEPTEEIPLELAERNALTDVSKLLLYASSSEHANSSLQKWSCALLRMMHVLAHLQDGFYNAFSDKIYQAIFDPLQSHLYHDPEAGLFLGLKEDLEQVPLTRFDMKPSKSLASSVIKLLTKKDATALSIYDKVGVRFVTKNIFDSFRVVRYLVDHNLISFPNVVADQSRNTLYPMNLFLECMEELTKNTRPLTDEEVDEWLQNKLIESWDRAEYKERNNQFSGANYRSIKFITRQIIQVNQEDRKLKFFYPYEIQIMDNETHLKNISGPEAHEQYKKRQLEAARQRVLGTLYKSP